MMRFKGFLFASALLAVVAFLGSSTASTSHQAWMKTLAAPGTAVAVDRDGNMYVTGSFNGTVDFDPGPGMDTQTGKGAYITRINADGTYGWTKTFQGTGEYDSNPSGIAIDSDGNIYTTGIFWGSIDFDPGPGEDIHTKAKVIALLPPVAPCYDVFITRINADGSYGWTKVIGDQPGSRLSSSSVAVAATGDVYIAGYIGNSGYNSSADFDPGPGTDIHSGRAAYLTKLNADGSYGWTHTWFIGYIQGIQSIAVTSLGDVYLTGAVDGGADFDPGPGVDNHVAAGNTDIFLIKMHADGSYAWTKTMGGPGYDAGDAVTTDQLGNIYVTGYFRDTADFNPDGGGDFRTAAFGQDIFLTRINADGTYGWTRVLELQGTRPSSLLPNTGTSVAADYSGGIYVTGIFSGSVDFDPGQGTDIRTVASNTVFITRINADGSYGWSEVPEGYAYNPSVAADRNGNAYLSAGTLLVKYATQTVDTTPDPFSFAPQTGVYPHTVATSNTITVTGINAPAPISITGGSYSIDGGPFTSVAGTVSNGQTVTVHQNAADAYGTSVTATLNIGGVSGMFSVTTAPLITINPPTPTTQDSVRVTMTFRPFQVCAWTRSVTHTISGSKIRIDIITTPPPPGVACIPALETTIVEDIGNLSAGSYEVEVYIDQSFVDNASFIVTEAPDTTPDPFSFVPQTGVAPGSVITSNAITVSGINAPAPISIIGGEYSVNGGAFTSAAGTVSNGQTVTVRLTAPSSYGSTSTAKLVIGTVSGAFYVTIPDSPIIDITITPAKPTSLDRVQILVNAKGGCWGSIVTLNNVGNIFFVDVNFLTPPPGYQCLGACCSTGFFTVGPLTPGTYTITGAGYTTNFTVSAPPTTTTTTTTRPPKVMFQLYGWTNPREQHQSYVERNGVLGCISCHSVTRGVPSNNPAAPSCFTCHGQKWSTGTTTTTRPAGTTTTRPPKVMFTLFGWTNPREQHQSYVERNGVLGCISCHSITRGVPSNNPAAPSCFTCHGQKWRTPSTTTLPGATTTTRPAGTTTTRPPKVMFTLYGWTNPREQHQSYVERKGITGCVSCHSVTRGVPSNNPAAPSCYTCHGRKWGN